MHICIFNWEVKSKLYYLPNQRKISQQRNSVALLTNNTTEYQPEVNIFIFTIDLRKQRTKL